MLLLCSSMWLSDYSYGADRILHSFPTRRSSDLGGSPAAGPGRQAVPPAVARGGRSSPGRSGRAFLAHLGFTDRKSTRLNSSHVKKSYAVFCMKKKTSGSYGFFY